MTRGKVVAGWLALLRRRWRWGLAAGAVVIALAAAVIFTQRPIYRAEARFRLGEAPPAPGVSPTSGIMGLFRMGGDPFANDLELLESRTLAEQMVDENALHVGVLAPTGWHRDSIFTSVRATRDTRPGMYELTWESDGAVSVVRTSPRDSIVGRFEAGAPIRFDGIELVPGPRRPRAPDRVRVSSAVFSEAARSTIGRLEVERTRREANVVRVRYDDPDPRLAQEVVASAVRAFIALRGTIMARESGETVDSLRRVAERTKVELAAAETELESVQTRTGLVAADAQSEVAVERFADVEAQLEQGRLELAAIDAVLARVETATDPASAWTTLVAHPAFLQNETMGALLTRLTELEQQRTQLASRRALENLDYRTITEQIADLDATLRAVARSYRTSLADRIEGLEGEVAQLRGQLARLPAQAMELLRRQRDIRLLGEVFLVTEQRLRQEELREALTFSNVQVIDPPARQYRPVWPRKKLGLAIGLMLALGTAVLAMVVVDSADATARSASELTTVSGAPVLAALAVGQHSALGNGKGPQAAALMRLGRDAERSPPPLVVAAVDDGRGLAIADQVRAALSGGDGREVRVAPPVTSYPAALEALAAGGPVLLAVVHGRTTLPDVERAARLLRDAGGSVAGLVVLVRTEEEAVELWA